MTRIKRPAAAAGAAVLLAFSLTACGGAPDDASEDDFCDAFAGVFEPFADITGDPTEDQWEDFQDATGELEDTGTPDNISGDEREGFEIFVEAIGDADYDDIKDADEESFPGVDKDDEAKVTQFFGYAGETCPEAFGVPTDLPTDLTEIPTDLPTDIPTDLSDLPTDLSDLTDLPTATE